MFPTNREKGCLYGDSEDALLVQFAITVVELIIKVNLVCHQTVSFIVKKNLHISQQYTYVLFNPVNFRNGSATISNHRTNKTISFLLKNEEIQLFPFH
jgi:hypothetical protein